jgi:hypothetical protein
MLAALRDRYYWPGHREASNLWVRICHRCIQTKDGEKSPRIGMPLERMACDIIRPMVKSYNCNEVLLVLTAYFTKWKEAYDLPDKQAEKVNVGVYGLIST